MMMATRVRAAQAGVEAWLQRHLVANGRASVRTAYSEVYAEPPQQPHRLREVPEGVPRPPYVRANCHTMPCQAPLEPLHVAPSLHQNLTDERTSSADRQAARHMHAGFVAHWPQPSSRHSHSGSEFVCMHTWYCSDAAVTTQPHPSSPTRRSPRVHLARILTRVAHVSCTRVSRALIHVTSCVSLTASHNCIRGSHDLTNLHACVSQPHLTLCVSHCPT